MLWGTGRPLGPVAFRGCANSTERHRGRSLRLSPATPRPLHSVVPDLPPLRPQSSADPRRSLATPALSLPPGCRKVALIRKTASTQTAIPNPTEFSVYAL